MRAGAEASLFSPDDIGISNVSDISSSEGNTMQTQDEHKNEEKYLFYCDWPELGSLKDFETNLRRKFDAPFEIGSNYFEVPLWSSICSPDARPVPSSGLFDNSNLSTVPNESTTNSILKSSVSVPDNSSTESVFLDQIRMINPIDIQQPSRNEGRDTPLNCEAHACSSSGEIEQFSQHSGADLFRPFDNVTSTERIGSCEGLEAIVCSNQEMLVPTSSSITCNDEIVSSSTCSGPDLVSAYVPCSMKKSHDPLNETPDMILDGMAENPLEIYFPPLTTYEQPELLMNGNSTQMHQFPEDFAGDDVLNSAGLQFCSTGRNPAQLCENPCSPLILEAVPVKDLGFQKLQEGMNQLDAATRTCVRDALYRLANCVEQRHCVAGITDSVNQLTSGVVESSGSKRFKSNRWTESQANPMDRSVTQLLLRKPLYRKTGLPHPLC